MLVFASAPRICAASDSVSESDGIGGGSAKGLRVGKTTNVPCTGDSSAKNSAAGEYTNAGSTASVGASSSRPKRRRNVMSSPEGRRLKVRPADSSPSDTVRSTDPASTSVDADTR